VVGIADTGLDDRSCYFVDTSESDVIQRSPIKNPYVDMSRRKVVQYSHVKKAQVGDLTAGHGTHVAGTVAGNNEEPLSKGGKYSGVAPGAKIAFLDIASASGALYAPGVSKQYSALQEGGAYVFSNSWGAKFPSSGGYYANAKVDEYLYTHMDTLILFANGNSGQSGLGTVLKQASSKNVVSVG
jgi:subtilisin family serine protease